MSAASDQTSNSGALAFLIDQTAPIEVGSVAVDAEGTMVRRDAAAPIRFGFRFAGRLFEAEAWPADGKLKVEFGTTIGHLPYSVENRQLRATLLRVLGGLRGTGLAWSLSPRQDLRVGGRATLDTPANAVKIVATVISQLLPERAYFDLIDEILNPPPPAESEPGTALAVG